MQVKDILWVPPRAQADSATGHSPAFPCLWTVCGAGPAVASRALQWSSPESSCSGSCHLLLLPLGIFPTLRKRRGRKGNTNSEGCKAGPGPSPPEPQTTPTPAAWGRKGSNPRWALRPGRAQRCQRSARGVGTSPRQSHLCLIPALSSDLALSGAFL